MASAAEFSSVTSELRITVWPAAPNLLKTAAVVMMVGRLLWSKNIFKTEKAQKTRFCRNTAGIASQRNVVINFDSV